MTIRKDTATHEALQHTAARRRLHPVGHPVGHQKSVSTHSRPKAAAFPKKAIMVTLLKFQHTAARRRLLEKQGVVKGLAGFNTQPPEGGCMRRGAWIAICQNVSTHSRPKAAA